jgi:hypothetical protein
VARADDRPDDERDSAQAKHRGCALQAARAFRGRRPARGEVAPFTLRRSSAPR